MCTVTLTYGIQYATAQRSCHGVIYQSHTLFKSAVMTYDNTTSEGYIQQMMATSSVTKVRTI